MSKPQSCVTPVGRASKILLYNVRFLISGKVNNKEDDNDDDNDDDDDKKSLTQIKQCIDVQPDHL